jgi:pyruvate/2-oxoglutarate/acetoin dehydrogenase E1 component
MVTMRRAGRDATLVAWAAALNDCLVVAASWAARGIDVEVLEVGSSVLLDDTAVLASVARTKNAVIVGVAPELSCRIHEELFAELEHPVARVPPAATRAEIDAALRRVLG